MMWVSMALQARTPETMDRPTNTMVTKCGSSMQRMDDAREGRYLHLEALVQRLRKLKSNIRC